MIRFSYILFSWKVTINHIYSYFASLRHFFLFFFSGFKNAQRQQFKCVLQKRYSSKCCKIYRKTRVLESVFNKVKFETLLKKTPRQVLSFEFFEIIKGNFFVKHLQASALLNADNRKDPRDCWSKISFFSPLRFLIFNDTILADLFMGCKNFIFKLFTKERRNSSEFSEFFALLSICFRCLIVVAKVVNLLLTFVICIIFSMFVLCHFGPWMK